MCLNRIYTIILECCIHKASLFLHWWPVNPDRKDSLMEPFNWGSAVACMSTYSLCALLMRSTLLSKTSKFIHAESTSGFLMWQCVSLIRSNTIKMLVCRLRFFHISDFLSEIVHGCNNGEKNLRKYLPHVHHFGNYTHGWFPSAILNSFPMTFMPLNWAKCGKNFPAVLIV